MMDNTTTKLPITNSPDNNLAKKIISLIPLGSILVVAIALLKTSIYYYNFNVSIKYYLGLSELGLLIADDLFIMAFWLFCLITLIFFSLPNGKIEQTKKKNPSTVNDFKNGYSLTPIILAAILIVTFSFFIYQIKVAKEFVDKLEAAGYFIISLSFVIFAYKLDTLHTHFGIRGLALVAISIMCLIFLVGSLTLDIRQVESGKYKGTQIITSDSTYTSTDSSFYIGQTTEYVFYHNKKEKYTTIIPLNEIKKIVLYQRYIQHTSKR